MDPTRGPGLVRWSSGGLLRIITYDLAHPFECQDDVLARVGVGEAQVALTVPAKARAGEAGDAGFLHEQVGQRPGGEAGARDARERVEGARGDGALEAGGGVEPGDD